MVTEILVASISGIIAVLIVALAYIQAKRLLFFETFFKRKADAFEEYIIAIGFIPRDDNELYNLSAITRKITLYCFAENKKAILDLLDLIIKAYQSRSVEGIPEEFQQSFRECRKTVVELLREEIQCCQNGNFIKNTPR